MRLNPQLRIGLLGSLRASLLGSAFSPASLFAAGESGYWLDPSDFSTMIQGSTGSTAPAVGQTVGLILDKSQGLVRGGDLVSDIAVDFSYVPSFVTSGLLVFNGLKSWSAARDASGHGTMPSKVGSALRAALGVLEVSFTLSDYDGPVSGITTLQCVISDSYANTLIVDTAGTYTILVPQATALTFSIGNSGRGYRIDNLVVRQIAGNHFYQATAAKRPLLQQDAQGFYYLQGDGTDDVLNSVVAVDPLGADKSQGFIGVYMISNAASTFPMGTSPSPASGGVSAPSNPGSWGIRMPSGTGSAVTAWPFQGTTRIAPTFLTSTLTKYVLSGLMDIPAPSIVVRQNAAEVVNSTASVGTGTFLPYTSFVLATATGFFPGRVYQVVCRFGPNLTAAQIDDTEDFVAIKTGFFAPQITGVPTIS